MERLLTAAKSPHLMTPRSSRWADCVCLTSGLFVGKPYGRIATEQANPEGGPGG
jgi:hypothetical protein